MDIQTLYLVANTSKKGALRTLAVLKAWSKSKGIEPISVQETRPHPLHADRAVVVALGGDGTVLRAASIFDDTGLPILGANMGSLGFLTQVRGSALTRATEAVLRDEYSLEKRMRLSFRIEGGRQTGTVLNDVVIAGPRETRFCELELLWGDGKVGSYPGDGLIVSTATGSTAYSLAAGGPVIVPPAACILASPLSAHKLGIRPVIFPADERLLVRTSSRASVYADGDFMMDLERGQAVIIQRADMPTFLMRMNDAPCFFEVLETKLNWVDDSKRRDSS